MKITRHIHQTLRLKNGLITLLLIVLLALVSWISRNYPVQTDLSFNRSNTLSTASRKILETLSDPIKITVYVKEPALKRQIDHLLSQYQRYKPDLIKEYFNPDQVPEQARKLKISDSGLVIVEYQEQNETIHYLDEASLTNALLKLSHKKESWITFLQGHGERRIQGQANDDLSEFNRHLQKQKTHAQELNLAQLSTIPDNSSLLVIASPTVPLLAGEVRILKEYLHNGGNLLWLLDPDSQNITELQQLLGITRLPGTIVDSGSRLYGVDDPSFVLISEYIRHPITYNFSNITVFPVASALNDSEESEFAIETLMNTVVNSWTETGPIAGKVQFDPDSSETEGPLTLAYALTREMENQAEQRIIVIGDGDFIANSFLGNAGNLELGLRMINWLIHDDQFVEIPEYTTPGRTLELSSLQIGLIGFGFLILLPIVLLFCGFLIWHRRKNS